MQPLNLIERYITVAQVCPEKSDAISVLVKARTAAGLLIASPIEQQDGERLGQGQPLGPCERIQLIL